MAAYFYPRNGCIASTKLDGHDKHLLPFADLKTYRKLLPLAFLSQVFRRSSILAYFLQL